jgi:small GTP-binding protein
MAITNYTAKEVQFKIVIYGPAFAGKTTTLSYILSNIEADSVSDLSTFKSAADKTLSFKFVPQNATLLDDFKILFELYTVPGKVAFNAPRRLMLRDADGILFVVDSEWPKIGENVASFKDLEDNLKKLGTNLDEIPAVLLYNKRDLADVAPVSYLNFVLNNRKTRIPVFETAAETGENIFAGLRTLSETIIQRFLENSSEAQSADRHAAESGVEK